jgi:hypothetical protein
VGDGKLASTAARAGWEARGREIRDVSVEGAAEVQFHERAAETGAGMGVAYFCVLVLSIGLGLRAVSKALLLLPLVLIVNYAHDLLALALTI